MNHQRTSKERLTAQVIAPFSALWAYLLVTDYVLGVKRGNFATLTEIGGIKWPPPLA
jgi:hypothetical protein